VPLVKTGILKQEKGVFRFYYLLLIVDSFLMNGSGLKVISWLNFCGIILLSSVSLLLRYIEMKL